MEVRSAADAFAYLENGNAHDRNECRDPDRDLLGKVGGRIATRDYRSAEHALTYPDAGDEHEPR
jgi:hypothetical protein